MTAAATPRATRPLAPRCRRRAKRRCPRTKSRERSTAARGTARRRRYERVLYEGYGPAGVAVLVEALTDNRNRAGAEIRHAFSTHGGSLGEPSSVAWNFEKRGVIVLDGDRYGEDDLMTAIDAGAEDVQEEGDKMRVLSEPTDLAAVQSRRCEEAGVEIESADPGDGAEKHGRAGEGRDARG